MKRITREKERLAFITCQACVMGAWRILWQASGSNSRVPSRRHPVHVKPIICNAPHVASCANLTRATSIFYMPTDAQRQKLLAAS